jgi:multiple sugar transport system ATP-binding protein
MTTVTYRQATRVFPGTDVAAVNKLDLEIGDGELLVLVGPSGSGKSTALRMLAGLEELNDGQIMIGDRDVSNVRPRDRDIAMVFQNYALYPHLTVAENMGFALKQAGVPKEERTKQVQEAARILNLEPYLDRKPKNLSGGQRQRVAMGRAIVRRPAVYLMDEPLSNLDAKLRVQTRIEVAELQQRLGVTMVYVTHDQVEAMTMGHRVAVLKDGLLQQVDTPAALYHSPVNVFVAGFIGSPAMNLAKLGAERPLRLGTAGVELGDADLGTAVSGEVTIGFRPESLKVGDGPLRGTIRTVEDHGSEAFVYLRAEGSEQPLVSKMPVPFSGRPGDEVSLQLTGPIHVFDADGLRTATVNNARLV